LYRSIRELLINVAKHADAQTVVISLTKVDDNIQITIQDDGIGFDTSYLESQISKSSGFGIFSIRERLANIGGNFKIQSSKGKGTIVTLQVPLTFRKAKKRIKL
jgi:signal transduction histidine kinase